MSTNRKPGVKASSAGKEKEIKRPPLKLFLEELKSKIIYVETFDELELPEYETAWNEWKEQLNYIEKAEDKLLFLKCLEIETNQIGLEEIKKDLLRRLQAVFHTKRNIAELLLAKMDHALRDWTTSGRNSSCVTIEDVYKELALDEDMISYNHDLITAEPFFSSRDTSVNDLEIELKNGNSRVISRLHQSAVRVHMQSHGLVEVEDRMLGPVAWSVHGFLLHSAVRFGVKLQGKSMLGSRTSAIILS